MACAGAACQHELSTTITASPVRSLTIASAASGSWHRQRSVSCKEAAAADSRLPGHRPVELGAGFAVARSFSRRSCPRCRRRQRVHGRQVCSPEPRHHGRELLLRFTQPGQLSEVQALFEAAELHGRLDTGMIDAMPAGHVEAELDPLDERQLAGQPDEGRRAAIADRRCAYLVLRSLLGCRPAQAHPVPACADRSS
jgi:hypothetical protein